VQFNQGDEIVIKSSTSIFRGCVGTFVEYRKGSHSDMCLVELLNGKRVYLRSCSIEKIGKDEYSLMSWDALMQQSK
jgi:hypothetical protein